MRKEGKNRVIVKIDRRDRSKEYRGRNTYGKFVRVYVCVCV